MAAGNPRTLASITGSKSHYSLLWLFTALAFAGWVILLAGVAALQQNCGSTPENELIAAGAVGYLAPVSCDKFYRYTWYHVFLQLFVVLFVVAALAGKFVHSHRLALVGFLAIISVLLMDTANTYLYYNGINNISDTTRSRARTTLAGAIICAVADLLLLLFLGIYEHTHYHKEAAYDVPAVGTAGTTSTYVAGPPTSTTTTTTHPTNV